MKTAKALLVSIAILLVAAFAVGLRYIDAGIADLQGQLAAHSRQFNKLKALALQQNKENVASSEEIFAKWFKQIDAFKQALAAREALIKAQNDLIAAYEARDAHDKATATAARITRGSYVPAARPVEQTRPAEPEAMIDLQKIKKAAEDRADTYFRFEYPAGSSSTLTIDVHIDLEEPEPMSGWEGQYRVRGRGHLEFFDSAGISFSRAVREFEVIVITDDKGGIKSREFTLR